MLFLVTKPSLVFLIKRMLRIGMLEYAAKWYNNKREIKKQEYACKRKKDKNMLVMY